MRWYLNDLSLQGQFADGAAFLTLLAAIVSARNQFAVLRNSLHATRSFRARPVGPELSLAQFLQGRGCREIRGLVLIWLDRTGPFMDDDRLHEEDDYFEFEGCDVTNTGLGEASRRTKFGEPSSSFSFQGGAIDFARSPLKVDHGLEEDRIGVYDVENFWTIDALRAAAREAAPEPINWRELIEVARERFPRLHLPDSVYSRGSLAREPFSAVIAERALVLLSHLNDYMLGRDSDGSEGIASRELIEQHFTGERALFTGESETNRRQFERELTFPDPSSLGAEIVAHWHGKISHRYFRLHFEWPVPANAEMLKVLYLGPKITKT